MTMVEPDPAGTGGFTEQRVEKEGERPDQDGNRVEEAGQVEVEEGSDQERQEEPVFEPSLEPAHRRGLGDPAGDQVEDRAERADPAAEKTAEEGGQDEDQKAGEEERHPPLRRQRGGGKGQRVGAEEGVDRNGDPVAPPVLGHEEQDQEDGEEDELADAGGSDFLHMNTISGNTPVFQHIRNVDRYTFTIRIFFRSISPSPRLWAATVTAISSGLRPNRVVA